MRVIRRLLSEAPPSDAGGNRAPACGCRPRFDEEQLVVDASGCEFDGRLASSPACRETAIGALAGREVETVLVRTGGVERAYDDASAALLVAAGRFSTAVADRDERLADLARREPLRAVRDAAARTAPVSTLAAETGLIVAAEGVGYEPGVGQPPEYRAVFEVLEAPTVAGSRVRSRPPDGGRLRSVRELETDAVARLYDTEAGPVYHLEPLASRLEPGEMATLEAARDRLAEVESTGVSQGGTTGRLPREAVSAVAGDDERIGPIARVLEKHTRGYGVLSDLFSDPRVSDVFATAPVDRTPIRVVAEGERMETNVRLTPDGARTLASRLRRESGRAFSRAAPTLDATADTAQRRIRAAGLADPATEGLAFAFRDHGQGDWTLPALVENGTMPPRAAGVLSLAVERDAAGLIAGTRGAGKTTLLGALLWELPPATRTVVVEDTPELPVDALNDAGRDVQGIRTSLDDGPSISPVEALRTALRLGDGALVLGEVRGEEASVLYEAMRVGASANATLGTIHGDGADAVRERVVSDLGVPVTAFGVTDVVVTVVNDPTGPGPGRVLGSIEEVIPDGEGVRFAELFALEEEGATATGRIERGDSHLVAGLSAPGESYADVVEAIEDRARSVSKLASVGQTGCRTVANLYDRERR
jgi:type IV secretory pathway ATPase VirB11/archaellum biosynthesis ATPase